MDIIKNVYCLQNTRTIFALQIGKTAILLGRNKVFNLRIELFTPCRKFRISYLFNNFWFGLYLCNLITKLLSITPKCLIKLNLKCYDLAKKIRDK